GPSCTRCRRGEAARPPGARTLRPAVVLRLGRPEPVLGGPQAGLVLQLQGDRDDGELVLRPRVLGRPAPTTLGHPDLAVEVQLPTPDAPRLTPRDGALQAVDHGRALGADRLGHGDVL